MDLYRNKKNHNLYVVINEYVIDATNGSDKIMVLYKEKYGNQMFVRELQEFSVKFTKVATEAE